MPTLLPSPAIYCLASEYDRLTPTQQGQVTHIVADDGTWTQEQILNALNPKEFSPNWYLGDWTRQ